MGLTISDTSLGKYFDQNAKNRLFIYRAPAQALLLSATTGGHPTLLNPLGSNTLFIPVRLSLGFLSGTTVIGSVLAAETQNIGGGAATGAAIVTATLVAPKSAQRPNGQGRCLWSPTTNTFTAAPTVIADLFNVGAVGPSAGVGPYDYWFDGTLSFTPGTALSIVYSVTTSTSLFGLTLWGIEVPWPLTA